MREQFTSACRGGGRLHTNPPLYLNRLGHHGVIHLLKLVAIRIAAALRMPDERARVAGRAAQRDHRLGEQLVLMCWIDPEVLEGLGRMGVHGFHDQPPTGSQRRLGATQEPHQRRLGQMLDHLGREHRTERSGGGTLHTLDGIGHSRGEALGPASLDHRGV